MISQMPSMAKSIELQTEGTFLNPNEFGLSDEILKLNALDRSPEIVAAEYMITAASRAKNSTAWSVLSFSGIGFGYWGRIQVAGSKIDQARLNREQVEVTLANQSYILNNSFHRTLDHFTSEEVVFNDTALFFESEFAKFNAKEIALDRLVETGILYLKDFREMVAAHYDALKKLKDLERVALGDVRTNALDSAQVEVVFSELNKGKYSISIATSEDVKSVEYIFENSGLNSMTTFNRSTGFGIVLKLTPGTPIDGHVNVEMKNGKIITKQFKF
jgi:hypothetical protein